MKVFKFGGASISTPERFVSTAEILIGNAQGNLLVVISAMGKTTNMLEAVVNAFFGGNTEEAISLFGEIKRAHLNLVRRVTNLQAARAEERLADFFTEAEWMLHDKPVREYDYYYDQIVCLGEMLSTCIMHFYLAEKNVNSVWLDVRDVLLTDDNYRAAGVNLAAVQEKVDGIVLPALKRSDVVLIQGFVGATDENESTTLGREGSDYSAALFANMLNAESVTIWKDVKAVMNADPSKFADARILPALSYTEVIEMAYYGAQVIHPKTIKPLQNKNIPLYVKCFLDPSLPGTVINNDAAKNLPPVIVVKNNQVLIKFRTIDFSFVEGRPTETLFNIFDKARHAPNLTQNAAISLMCCFDEHEEKINKIATAASTVFDVEVEKGLSLITVRRPDDGTVEKLIGDKDILVSQRTREMSQTIVKEK